MVYLIGERRRTNEDLVEAARTNWLEFKAPRDERVLESIRKVDRINFLPDEYKNEAYDDGPVPIGHGATCSMPSLVAVMADLLELGEGQNVLEIGTGCGYSAAITKHLIGRRGRLTSVEIDYDLANTGRKNLWKHFSTLEGFCLLKGDGSKSCSRNAPYDRIYLTAAANLRNFSLKSFYEQLKQGGLLMFPEENSGELILIRRKSPNANVRKYKSVIFVPLQQTDKPLG